ncbi:MAG: hypothetical protein MMC23_007916 [Stictis urceolatum]|nr:hypothetical protein [Stictis urceolata]
MAILKTDTLPAHLHSLRRLILQDDSELHLQVSPPASVPLLRHERTELETEATTLRLLHSAGLPVPRVLRHSTDPALLGAPFLLTTSSSGIPLSQILPTAPRHARKAFDAQIDALERQLKTLRSSNFGPVNLVERKQGFSTWTDAFGYMLGSVLKDGEDMFVNLPYAQIRDVVRLGVCRDALAEIRVAELCVGGLGGPDGVLVEVGGEERERMVCGLVGFKVAWWGDRELERGRESGNEREGGKGEDGEKGVGDVELGTRAGTEGWEVVRKGLGREVRVAL